VKSFVLITLLGIFCPLAIDATTDKTQRVLSEARQILEYSQASYVYGGSTLGEELDCQSCNTCLAEKKPEAKMRLEVCAICKKCSLDCSHFTALVFRRAGLKQPYLTTRQMLDLSAQELRSRYSLIDLGRRWQTAQAGDLLVYRGHVVLVESVNGERADIIHATSGLAIREPGQGIQRERQVPIENFRGPLLRVLRHLELQPAVATSRFRPVTPR